MEYVLRRLGFYALAAWASLTFNFILPRLMPGDPGDALAAQFQGRVTPETLAAMEEAYGLSDDPIWKQYLVVPGTCVQGRARRFDLRVSGPGERGDPDSIVVDAPAGRRGGDHQFPGRDSARDSRGVAAWQLGRFSSAAVPAVDRFVSLLLAGDACVVLPWIPVGMVPIASCL